MFDIYEKHKLLVPKNALPNVAQGASMHLCKYYFLGDPIGDATLTDQDHATASTLIGSL